MNETEQQAQASAPENEPEVKIKPAILTSEDPRDQEVRNLVAKSFELLSELDGDVTRRLSKIIDKVDKLERSIKRLKNKLGNSVDLEEPDDSAVSEPAPAPVSPREIVSNLSSIAKAERPKTIFTDTQSLPVPEDIQASLDATLGVGVGIRLEAMKDSPSFMIHLTIPDTLSKSLIQPDVRSARFTYAQGLPAVREWLKKVRQNIYLSFQRAGEPVNLP